MNQYCLKVGNKYTNKDVYKLADQVGNIDVITDDVSLSKDFTIIPVDNSLPTVWNKMRLFDTDQFPDEGIFFDLDIHGFTSNRLGRFKRFKRKNNR